MGDVLWKVKKTLGITGNYQDDTLNEYISEVKSYMSCSGVPKNVIKSDISAGVIARGVCDLWTCNGKFSEYFFQRVIQLRYMEGEETEDV